VEGPLTTTRRTALATCVAVVMVGCGVRPAPYPVDPPRRFAFATDTFGFANESHFEYATDPATGMRTWGPRRPPATFALRCAGLVRGARQFFVNARFDPGAARVEPERYLALVRQVLRRDPRTTTATEPPVVIPGFADLRSFSAAYADMLKGQFRAWQEVMPRGDWKLVVPFLPSWQDRTATHLLAEVEGGGVALVRVIRFPNVTLNHAVLLFEADEHDGEVVFQAYDPNDPAGPITLTFDRTARSFFFPPRRYFDGGPVKVYEIYAGWLS
jgi:hypothetical protein